MKIVDISTPQQKKRVILAILFKLHLRLFGAYIRRDTVKIGLKLIETKWAIVNNRHERRMAKHEKRIAEIEKSLENEERG